MDPFYETMLVFLPTLVVGGVAGAWLLPKLDRFSDWIEWRWSEWRNR